MVLLRGMLPDTSHAPHGTVCWHLRQTHIDMGWCLFLLAATCMVLPLQRLWLMLLTPRRACNSLCIRAVDRT